MSSALQMKEAHFPQRAPIDAYGNGGFRFADMSHRGSILCLPSGIYGIELCCEIIGVNDIRLILKEADAFDFLLLGTGETPKKPSLKAQEVLSDAKIRFDTMTTGAAVRTFNVLLSEERPVAALLYAVE